MQNRLKPYISDNSDFIEKLKAAVTLVGGSAEIVDTMTMAEVAELLKPNYIKLSFEILVNDEEMI